MSSKLGSIDMNNNNKKYLCMCNVQLSTQRALKCLNTDPKKQLVLLTDGYVDDMGTKNMTSHGQTSRD